MPILVRLKLSELHNISIKDPAGLLLLPSRSKKKSHNLCVKDIQTTGDHLILLLPYKMNNCSPKIRSLSLKQSCIRPFFCNANHKTNTTLARATVLHNLPACRSNLFCTYFLPISSTPLELRSGGPFSMLSNPTMW